MRWSSTCRPLAPAARSLALFRSLFASARRPSSRRTADNQTHGDAEERPTRSLTARRVGRLSDSPRSSSSGSATLCRLSQRERDDRREDRTHDMRHRTVSDRLCSCTMLSSVPTASPWWYIRLQLDERRKLANRRRTFDAHPTPTHPDAGRPSLPMRGIFSPSLVAPTGGCIRIPSIAPRPRDLRIHPNSHRMGLLAPAIGEDDLVHVCLTSPISISGSQYRPRLCSGRSRAG